jgi:phosphoribosylformylglycinamidine cyclo-ligase
VSAYASAGVSLAAAEDNVKRIAQHVKSTHGPQVLGDFGAFGGLFHLTNVEDPVLVASTDGVGTKLLLAIELGRYELVGQDLVNLSVNDVLTTGARPLFFLDYVGTHAIDANVMDQLVGGMARACRENSCALLGGETAQLKDLYAEGHFDLAGTVVGVVERDKLIDGRRVAPADAVWALPSTGLHTNGYTLARRLIAGMDLQQDPGGMLGQSLADALLAPHPSYLPAMKDLLGEVKSMAHITGGGLPGNLPRVLPNNVDVSLDWGSWPVPPIFTFLQEIGGIDDQEMVRVFNMGLGMVFVTAPDLDVPSACAQAMPVGRVVAKT